MEGFSFDVEIPGRCDGCRTAQQCVSRLALARTTLLQATMKRGDICAEIAANLERARETGSFRAAEASTAALDVIRKFNMQMLSNTSGAIVGSETALGAAFGDCAGYKDGVCGMSVTGQIAAAQILQQWPERRVPNAPAA